MGPYLLTVSTQGRAGVGSEIQASMQLNSRDVSLDSLVENNSRHLQPFSSSNKSSLF